MAELFLQGVGDGEGVGLRVGARQLGRDQDRRDVDRGEGRDGKGEVGSDADHHDASHQHEREHGSPDEKRRETTLFGAPLAVLLVVAGVPVPVVGDLAARHCEIPSCPG
jgi:hypothetical protein